MLAIPNGDKRMGKKTALCWEIFNSFVKLSICLFLARICMQSASRYDRLCLVSRALFVCSPLFKPVKGQFRQIAAKGGKIFYQKGSCLFSSFITPYKVMGVSPRFVLITQKYLEIWLVFVKSRSSCSISAWNCYVFSSSYFSCKEVSPRKQKSENYSMMRYTP